MRYDDCYFIMPLYQAIILAVVQGFTEFLPISSSAHLALAPWLLGWEDPGLTFDIALHFGTLVALLMYFFRDWVQVTAQGFGLQWGNDAELKKNPRLLWLLAAASLPIGFFGYTFQDKAETTWRNPLMRDDLLDSGDIKVAYHFTDVSPKGVQGDPTLASKEKGERFLAMIVDEVAKMLVDFSRMDLKNLIAGIAT